jgi:hypothetical protein
MARLQAISGRDFIAVTAPEIVTFWAMGRESSVWTPFRADVDPLLGWRETRSSTSLKTKLGKGLLNLTVGWEFSLRTLGRLSKSLGYI